jgi:hypothetical protein
MNPGLLLIIRNNFPFTLSLFLFSVIINFENTKTFPLLHFTNQNTTTIPLTVYHCIAYYISLHIPAAKDFLALLHLHIYLFSIAYLFSGLYTYTHLLLDNHLVRLRAQSNFFTLQVVRRETWRILIHTVPREFDINPRVTFVGKIKLPMLNTLLLESQPSEASYITLNHTCELIFSKN